MTRAIAVMACSLALAACSSWNTSWMPSFELFSSKPSVATLTIESDPPGAEARTSIGGTCRTPCSLPVQVSDEFTVSYALTGYMPQTVPVRPLPGESSVFGSGSPTQFDPNPVFAALQPAAPAKPPPPKRRKRPATAAAPRPIEPPPSMGGFAPPPGTFSPPGTIR
jgi:hypothetical protein